MTVVPVLVLDLQRSLRILVSYKASQSLRNVRGLRPGKRKEDEAHGPQELANDSHCVATTGLGQLEQELGEDGMARTGWLVCIHVRSS